MNDNQVSESNLYLKAPSFLKWIFLCGVFWLALGVAYIPINKVYQQGIIVLFFLPVLLFFLLNTKIFYNFISSNNIFFSILGVVFLYAALHSTFLGNFKSAKHVIYVLLFVFSGLVFVFLDYNEKVRSKFLFLILAVAMFIALASIYNFFYIEGHHFSERMWGVLGVNHPILGSYYIGVFLLACLFLIVDQRKLNSLPLLIVMSAYIVFAQSRGAYLAIFIAPILYGAIFLRHNKYFKLFLFIIFTCAALLVYFLFEQIMLRGSSNRFEIISLALEVGVEKLWFGYGIGYDFSPHAIHSTEVFYHTHNLLTHIFIELGVFGVLFFIALWLYCLYYCFRNTEIALARFNILLILFSSIAFQFDAASFIAQPRLEWFIVWVPITLTVAVMAIRFMEKSKQPVNL